VPPASAAFFAPAAQFAVTSAAVLGRPGEVGPVAAALALVLRRETRSRVATVVVLGDLQPDLAGGGGGGSAARRAAERLEAHGLEAVVRGRTVWTRIDPRQPELVSLVRAVTLVAAPVVVAVTAPRTVAVDEVLAGQDLLVLVTAEPDGALARSAAQGLNGAAVVPVAPLTRSPARALARAGLRAPVQIRRLIPTTRGRRR